MSRKNKQNPFDEVKDRVKLYKAHGVWVSALSLLTITGVLGLGVSTAKADTTTANTSNITQSATVSPNEATSTDTNSANPDTPSTQNTSIVSDQETQNSAVKIDTDTKADSWLKSTDQNTQSNPNEADAKVATSAETSAKQQNQGNSSNTANTVGDNAVVDSADKNTDKAEDPAKMTTDNQANIEDKTTNTQNTAITNTDQEVKTDNSDQSNVADTNRNVKNLVLATQNEGTSQYYSYDASTGDGVDGDITFHFDKSTGVLTFTGSGTIPGINPPNKDDYKISWDTQIAPDVKKIIFTKPVKAPQISTNLFRSQNYPQLHDFSGLEFLDVSDVTDFQSMFYGLKLPQSVLSQMSNWNVSNGKSFESMLDYNNFTDATPVQNWNMSNATNISAMFALNNFTSSAPFNAWANKVGNVTDMSCFIDSNNIQEINGFVNWDVRNVVNFWGMFSYDELTDISGLKNWSNKVSKGTDFHWMFEHNYLTTTEGVNNWQTINGIDFSGMFANNHLVDVSAAKTMEITNKAQNLDGIFYLNNLSSFVAPMGWDTSNVKSMAGFLESNPNLTKVDMSNLDMRNIDSSITMHMYSFNNGTGTFHMFHNDPKLCTLILGQNSKLFSDSDLVIPSHNQSIPDGTNHKATGHWQEIGSGSQTNPNGTIWDGNYANFKPGTWVWQPEQETITVSYVDDETGETLNAKLPASANGISGLVGDNNSYTMQQYIDMLTKAGYAYVKTTNAMPSSFDKEGNQQVTVHFNHSHSTVTDNSGEGSVTIHYQYGDKTQAKPDDTEKIGFTRTGDQDNVTKNINWNGWTPKAGSKVDVNIPSPTINGYTPDQASVSANIEEGKNKDVTVTYNADAESATVNYVDQDNGNSVLKSSPIFGKFGDKSNYSTAEEIKALEAAGYDLVSDGYPKDGYTFNTDKPTFTIVLKHHISKVTPDKPGTPSQPVDPNNPNGPKYPNGTSENDLTKTITRTIHYQYANGSEASKDVVETVKYGRDATFDDITGKVSYGDWTTDNANYAEVDAPTIKGYTPDQSVVKAAGTTSSDTNSDVKVTYNADAESATVNYVDQDNGNSVVKSDALNGKFGDKSNYSTAEEIKALEAAGYDLVSDGYPKDGYTFNTDKPTFTIVLKHHMSKVTPDKPGTPSQPVDPNNPNGPKYPNGTSENDLTKTITRTIHYQYANGSEASKDVVETVKYSRDATFDDITGKVSYGDWTTDNATYAEVDSPAIKGYTPDQSVVKEAPTTSSDTNNDVKVTYNADAESATVNYVDQDNGNSVVKSDALNGKFGDKSNYSTAAEIKALEAAGYDLVSDGYPKDGYTFNTDKPTFTIVLKHHISKVTPDKPGTPSQPVDPNNPNGPKYPNGTSENDLTKTITRTIHYQYANGSEASKDVVETVKYSRDATFDDITGKVSYGDWTTDNANYAEVDSPTIKGYTPDQSVVKAAGTTSTDKNGDVKVTYNADAESATVTYVDQDNGNSVVKSDAINGKFGDKSNYSTADEIKALEAAGYDLVSDGYPKDGYTFNTDKPTFTIVLKHHMSKVTPDKPGTPSQPVDPNNPNGPKYPNGTSENDLTKTITRTIHYQYTNGSEASKDVIETVKYSRDATFDDITGKVSYGDWTTDNATYAEVDSPTIKGYTPDQSVVKAAPTTSSDTNSDVKVTYNADAESATVNYVDQDNGNSVVKSDALNGKFGDKSNYSTADEIKVLEAAGYDLVSDGYPKDGYTFNTDKPTFTIVLKHHMSKVTPDKPGTPSQPVDPNNPNGPKYPNGTSENDLTKTITRTIHYQYANGSEASKDVVETVKYSRDAVFDDITGKVSYGDWTTDNAKYAEVESPTIKGYTPDQSVVKATPTTSSDTNSDVKVTYNADAESATVNYVDQDNGNSVVKSDALNGEFGDKSNYSTADEIKVLEAAGYDLVSDGYPKDGYTFNTDKPTFTIVLKHHMSKVTPDKPGTPSQPVDPNNPNGPKYPNGTSENDLTKTITRTIHYQYANGSEASKDVVETVKYGRDATFDDITGKVTYGDWTTDNANYAEVDSPTIEDYTPDQSVVKSATVTAKDSNTSDTVIYRANKETIHINYVDGQGHQIADSDTMTGKFGDDYLTLGKTIPGYHLVRIDGTVNGKYTENTPDVTYVYEKNPLPAGKPTEVVSASNPVKPAAPSQKAKEGVLPQTGSSDESLLAIVGSALLSLSLFGTGKLRRKKNK